jgi:hypothetical protein
MNNKNGGTINLAQKKSYSRYFIILQEDEKGYSLAQDKLCSGYAKLEMKNDKCKVSYYVQNLKKESAPYFMILICNKKDVKKLIKIGEMNIDDSGRSEVSFEYPANDIKGSGIPMDRISGAAVVRFLNSEIIPVMSGFASTDIPDWKSFEIIQEKEVKPEEKPDKIEEETSIFDKYEEDVQKVKETEEGSEAMKPEEAEVEEKIESHEEVEKNDTLETEAPVEEKEDNSFRKKEHEHKHEHKEEHEEEYKEEYKEEHLGKHPMDSVGEFFMKIVEGFEEMMDICSEIKRCRWFRVPVNSIYDMTNIPDYNKYTIIYYPLTNYYSYINKYGHFLIGYKYDVSNNIKYLVYAIPGTKSKMDQPFEGKSGFVTWVPMRDGEDKETSFGYWIMFYDFRTSTIIIPVK